MALNKALLYSGPVEYVRIDNDYFYYTFGGVTISFTTEFIDLHCDQIPGITNKIKKHHEIIIKFKIPELNNTILKYALNQPDGQISGTYLDIAHYGRPICVVTVKIPHISGRIRSFVFSRCICLGISEISINKGIQTAFEVQFASLCNPNAYPEEYGYALEQA